MSSLKKSYASLPQFTNNLPKKKVTSEKLESYLVSFEAALTNVAVEKEFEKYLKTEFNIEPWNFLMEIQKLENLKKDKEIIQKVDKIIDLYVKEGSKKQINISGRARKELISNFELQQENEEEWILTVQPKDFFKKLYQIISNELYHDSWKRFSRSNEYKQIIQKYCTDTSICRPRITEEFHYGDDYFTHPYIEGKKKKKKKIFF